MKKYCILIVILTFIVCLIGCAKGVESCPSAESLSGAAAPDEAENSIEDSSQNIISSDMLGQGIYDALEAEWTAWNAKDDFQKAISSHMPGYVYKKFDTWAECEEFLGFELFHPLENSEFEKGSYVGMPEGFNEASRFYVSFYGTEDGKVERISVESGYRDGDIRITVRASVRPDEPLELAGEQMITEDSGEHYVAASKLMVIGPVTYNIRVIGEANQWDEVRATLQKVLPYFTESEEK